MSKEEICSYIKHIWYRKGIERKCIVCNKEQVMSIMKKMARIVDKQNENDQDYKKMSDDFEGSIAFSAACDLVFKGRTQPSGYTEPLLHKKRLEKKTSKL